MFEAYPIQRELMLKFEDYLAPLSEKYGFTYKISPGYNKIEVIGKTSTVSRFQMFTINILPPAEPTKMQFHVTELFLPDEIRGSKLVLGLMNVTRQVAHKLNCDFLLVGMVPGFYRKMIGRGAVNIEEYESVLIIDTTNLK